MQTVSQSVSCPSVSRTERQTHRLLVSQTDRQTDREKDRKADRQTDRIN